MARKKKKKSANELVREVIKRPLVEEEIPEIKIPGKRLPKTKKELKEFAETGEVSVPTLVQTFPNEFLVLGADLSLRCPAFMTIKFNKETQEILVVEKMVVNNKNYPRKKRGEILCEIATEIVRFAYNNEILAFVREKGFSRFSTETQALFGVVGVSDQVLWMIRAIEWNEIAPASVKKFISGSGRATKDEVQESLGKFVEDETFSTQDESDALGVAISWLIREGFITDKPDKRGT